MTANSLAAGVKKVQIQAVPDRGGRADEMRPKAADIRGFGGTTVQCVDSFLRSDA